MKEMARIGIKPQLNPQRCTICNGTLREAVKCLDNENGHLPNIRRTWECEDCGKLYWAGSHWKKIEEILEKICSGKC